MPHRREAPEDDRNRKPDARADPIHQPARDQKADRVRELEGKDDVAVVQFAPAELLRERRLQQADHLPVDVVDRGGKEQQAANDPPDISGPLRNGRRWRLSTGSLICEDLSSAKGPGP